jgi:LmbE family N-acetylglucosaminyl deacetylase
MSRNRSLRAVVRSTVRLRPLVGKESKRVVPAIVPRRVLVFAPHADDELLSCGGTILKYVEWGTEVVVLVATSGLGGTSRPRRSSEVEKIRSKEFEDCRKELGLSGASELLGIEEPLVRRVNVELFTRRIRELKPDLVFLPHPEDRHRVHREVSLLTLEALFHSPTRAYAGRGREWLPYGAYFYETLSGMFGSTIAARGLAISDITDHYVKKMKIMRKAYRTQRHLLKTYASWIEEMARLRGVAGRCRYGEAFVPETGHVPLKILVV